MSKLLDAKKKLETSLHILCIVRLGNSEEDVDKDLSLSDLTTVFLKFDYLGIDLSVLPGTHL